MSFVAQSERISKLHLKRKYNISLINVYAPTEDKEKFNEELQYVFENSQKMILWYILGDFNVPLGKEKCDNNWHSYFT